MDESGDGDDAICPMVIVEWDRGHASIEAIVRAEHDAGIIVSTIHDHVPLPGLRWIRSDEVFYRDNLEALPDDHPAVRLAAQHGSRQLRLPPDLADLDVLLADLCEAKTLVMVHVRRTGSGSGRVGRTVSATASELVLDDVSTEARYSGDQLHIDVNDIISVEWGDNYLSAIDQLLTAESDST